MTVYGCVPLRGSIILGLLTATLLLIGCGATLDPVPHPSYLIGGSILSADEVQVGVRNGVVASGWSLVKESPGQTTAQVTSGGHFAKVVIYYNRNEYVIHPVELSEGLRYDGVYVHKRYTFWVNRLHRHLQREIYHVVSSKSYETVPSSPDVLEVHVNHPGEPPKDSEIEPHESETSPQSSGQSPVKNAEPPQ